MFIEQTKNCTNVDMDRNKKTIQMQAKIANLAAVKSRLFSREITQ